MNRCHMPHSRKRHRDAAAVDSEPFRSWSRSALEAQVASWKGQVAAVTGLCRDAASLVVGYADVCRVSVETWRTQLFETRLRAVQAAVARSASLGRSSCAWRWPDGDVPGSMEAVEQWAEFLRQYCGYHVRVHRRVPLPTAGDKEEEETEVTAEACRQFQEGPCRNAAADVCQTEGDYNAWYAQPHLVLHAFVGAGEAADDMHSLEEEYGI